MSCGTAIHPTPLPQRRCSTRHPQSDGGTRKSATASRRTISQLPSVQAEMKNHVSTTITLTEMFVNYQQEWSSLPRSRSIAAVLNRPDVALKGCVTFVNQKNPPESRMKDWHQHTQCHLLLSLRTQTDYTGGHAGQEEHFIWKTLIGSETKAFYFLHIACFKPRAIPTARVIWTSEISSGVSPGSQAAGICHDFAIMLLPFPSLWGNGAVHCCRSWTGGPVTAQSKQELLHCFTEKLTTVLD